MRISDWSSDVCSSDLINYAFDLASISGGANPGRLELNAEATHTSLLTTSVTGSSFTRTDNTVDQPDWSGRFTATYINGGFRASYQLAYLDSVLWQPDATIESTPVPVLKRRSEEHTSELQSLMRNSYAVFRLKKKKSNT